MPPELTKQQRVTRSFSTDTGLVFISQGIRQALTLCSWGVIARQLGPVATGEVQAGYLCATTIVLFINFGLPVANLYLAGKKAYRLSHFLGNVFLRAGIESIAAISILWLLRSLVLRAVPISIPAYIIVLAWLPLQLVNYYLASLMTAERRFLQQFWINLVQGAAFAIAVAIATFWFHFDAKGVLILFLASTGLSTLLQLWFLRDGLQLGHMIPPAEMVKHCYRFGIRGYFANVAQFMTYRLDSFIVAYLLGAGPLGIYSTSYNIAEVLWYAPTILATVLLPTTASSTSGQANWRTARVSRLTLLTTALGGVAIALTIPYLIPHFLTPKFEPAVLLTWLLLPGIVVFSLAKVISADLIGRGLPQYSSYGALLAFVVTFALDIVFIPRYGLRAAAAASSVVYVAEAGYLLYYFVKISGVDYRSSLFVQRADLVGLKVLAQQRLKSLLSRRTSVAVAPGI